MREVEKIYYNNLKDLYLKDNTNKIVRRALVKNKIKDLTKINEETEFSRNMFSVNLKTLPVADQKRSGRCWIFAGCNVIREKFAQKYNLEKFELSQNYISFYDKLEKCNYVLENVKNLIDNSDSLDENIKERTLDIFLTDGVQDGGQWDMFVNIVNKYGIVPKNAYPETFQSSNTDQINDILNKCIRKFAYMIKYDSEGINHDELKQRFMTKIYSILCSSFGVPPEKFSFEYVDKDKNYNIIKDLDPHKFYEMSGINLDDYVSIINSPTHDKQFNKLYTVKYVGNVIEGKEITYLNLEMERLKQAAIAQLKDGEPVWFGSDCIKDGDRDECVWDDKMFDTDTLFQINSKMEKGAMLETRESAMNHAMVLTGVNLDNDKSTKWKIENSWGDIKPNKGYYVATDSWFDKYVYQVVVNKKYLTDEEKFILTTEKNPLTPWDPMGTLAD